MTVAETPAVYRDNARLRIQLDDAHRKIGAAQFQLDEAAKNNRALVAARFWKTRATGLFNFLHDELLAGSEDGLRPEQCEGLREQIAAFLEGREVAKAP